MTRPKNSLLVELTLLVWLVVVWGALWGDFGPGNLLVGVVLALLVTWVLYLPPVQLSGRFNPFQFALFAVTFVWQVAKASFEVMLIAILVGPRARNAVVGVQLRTRSDLLLTATGHTMTLYCDRQAQNPKRPKQRWWLYTIRAAATTPLR